jgi:hypothetical protein
MAAISPFTLNITMQAAGGAVKTGLDVAAQGAGKVKEVSQDHNCNPRGGGGGVQECHAVGV